MEGEEDRMRSREGKGGTFLFKPSLCCSMLLKGKRTIMVRKWVCVCVCVCGGGEERAEAFSSFRKIWELHFLSGVDVTPEHVLKLFQFLRPRRRLIIWHPFPGFTILHNSDRLPSAALVAQMWLPIWKLTYLCPLIHITYFWAWYCSMCKCVQKTLCNWYHHLP